MQKITKTPKKSSLKKQKDESKMPSGKGLKGKIQNENKMPKMSPKFLARQEKIKAVALKMFIAKGYEQTNLKDIIKESGGSFSDIYIAFKNKRGLFINVINDVLEEKRTEYVKILNKKLPLRETLLELSLYMMESLLHKKSIAIFKMMYSQLYNKSHRILIEHFKRNKEKAPEQALENYFKTCEAPLCDEAQRYAELFLTLIKGKCIQATSFFKVSFKKDEREEYANFIVDFFINALR